MPLRSGLRRVRTALTSEPERPAPATPSASATPLFYGYTRYSVFSPASRSWKLTRGKDSDRDYFEQLYAEQRMRPRADIFLELSVPILQQMAQVHDYRHLVHYSAHMPQPWLGQLQEAARRYPVLWLVEADEQPVLADTLSADLRERGVGDCTVVNFRIDDDDILATTYLDQLSAFAGRADRNRAISLARGAAGVYLDGRIEPLLDQQRPFGAQGQAYVGNFRARDGRLFLRGGPGIDHTKVARHLPTIVDAREIAWLQLRHPGQDMLIDEADALDRIRRSIAHLPPLTDTDIAALFPTIVDRLISG